MKAEKTLAAINAKLEQNQEKKHRKHLGASVLGNKCSRQIYYSFRWFFKELFEGQMLRLFDRGHLEENRFMGWLEMIGCKTWPTDPSTGKQWRISFGDGHGGGSCDGVAIGSPDLPSNTPFLCEFKTHNRKSFESLQKEGLCQSKPEHFAQTQIYTVKLGLPVGIYWAVNKDDDNLHPEIIQPNPQFVATLIDKGERIIWTRKPPAKIAKSPGHWYCKNFCRFTDICHNGTMPEKNCRTCQFSAPVAGGEWFCERYSCKLTFENQTSGCADWVPIL